MPSGGSMTPFDYWVHEAHKNPEAKELAARLKLDLPCGEMRGFKVGFVYPIRRLVVTGEDTPENFALFFGQSLEKMLDVHDEQRTQLLMAPSPVQGSPMSMMSGFMDEGCPKWSPRPASDAEKKQIEVSKGKVDQLQALLRSLN